MKNRESFVLVIFAGPHLRVLADSGIGSGGDRQLS
jgi:hypothetical protein